MRIISLDKFCEELQAQEVESHMDFALICPACGTVQSARDLIGAGAGDTFDDVEKYFGFSCVGRWLDAGTPRLVNDGKPCNWTLGGLFQTHDLEVETPDGERLPLFEVATKEQAHELIRKRKQK